MEDSNIVELFPNAGKATKPGNTSGGGAIAKTPFLTFPPGMRMEIVPGVMFISLALDADTAVKKTWRGYLNSLAAVLILAGVPHELLMGRDPDTHKEVPDAIKILLPHKNPEDMNSA